MIAFRLLAKALLSLYISIPVMLVILAMDQHAISPGNTELSDEQIANIQQLLIDHDPRLLINTDDQAIQLSENELNALLSYTKNNFPALNNTSISSHINSGTIDITASLPVPENPFGRFINITILGVQDENFVSIDAIQIGALRIPSQLYSPLLDVILSARQEKGDYQLFSALLASVNQTSLEQDRLSITLNWETENLETIQQQAREVFVNPEEITRLLQYNRQISEISRSFPVQARTINLSDYLQPMFSSALINSANGADPQAENRAIFLALTVYLTELRLEHLTGPVDENQFSIPRQLNVVIESRLDLPRHIISSAAIAASAGANVANILSVYKEVQDSRYQTGTGFSFSDITANQVGTNLGELSSQNTSSALQLQTLMSQLQSDSEYMPLVMPLDGMSEQEFIDRYQNRESEQYQQRLLEIEREISQRPFFQNLSSVL